MPTATIAPSETKAGGCELNAIDRVYAEVLGTMWSLLNTLDGAMKIKPSRIEDSAERREWQRFQNAVGRHLPGLEQLVKVAENNISFAGGGAAEYRYAEVIEGIYA